MRSAPKLSKKYLMSAEKWDVRTAGAVVHNGEYYLKCMFGGFLACGFTHAAITPLDVTKCNMQVNALKYPGLGAGIKTIIAEEGAGALWKGVTPTFLGYAAQGMFKFGLYEYFKDFYSNLAGKEDAETYKSLIWLAGAASAEFVADIALCPLEMTKVKIQTSVPGTFPTAFFPAISAMKSSGTNFPFGSLVPLWSRQIPYTMAKFAFFEKIVQLFCSIKRTAPNGQ